jgi:transcriptional regulator with XRE-family HTH domain
MSNEGDRGLADKLNKLFANVRPDVGHEYSNEHVAAAIRRTGVTISQSYIWQLRKGLKTNPTLKHLEALAGFFGVPTAYFLDTQASNRVAEQLELLAETQARLAHSSPDSDVKLMAMRAGQLSAARRKQVMDLLDVVYRLEQAEQQNTP